jgi:hypothetical protein
MTSRETDTLTLEADIEAAISDELEAINTGSADVLDRAGNAILELVARAAGTAQADLQEALRNLQISFEPPAISFELPATR